MDRIKEFAADGNPRKELWRLFWKNGMETGEYFDVD